MSSASKIIRASSFPRAGLIGNPSDGFHGKTIAFIVRNFQADVTLWESPELVIEPNQRDHTSFASITKLLESIDAFGYYGGLRLLQASVRRFHGYCKKNGSPIHSRNFTVRTRAISLAMWGLLVPVLLSPLALEH